MEAQRTRRRKTETYGQNGRNNKRTWRNATEDLTGKRYKDVAYNEGWGREEENRRKERFIRR